MSLGQDIGDAPFQIRARADPRRGALLHRRPRHHRAGAGTHDGAVLDHHRGRSAARPCRSSPPKKVDIVKIWVDDRNGQFKKLTPELYGAVDRRGAQELAPGHRAPLHARGCEGAVEGRHRRLRARRPRSRHRRRVPGDGQDPSRVRAGAEPARSRREDRSELAEGQPAAGGAAEARGREHRSPGGADAVRDPGAQSGEDERRGRAHRGRIRRQHAVGAARRRWPTWSRPG